MQCRPKTGWPIVGLLYLLKHSVEFFAACFKDDIVEILANIGAIGRNHHDGEPVDFVNSLASVSAVPVMPANFRTSGNNSEW